LIRERRGSGKVGIGQTLEVSLPMVTVTTRFLKVTLGYIKFCRDFLGFSIQGS
jgi:hypothetical protein